MMGSRWFTCKLCGHVHKAWEIVTSFLKGQSSGHTDTNVFAAMTDKLCTRNWTNVVKHFETQSWPPVLLHVGFDITSSLCLSCQVTPANNPQVLFSPRVNKTLRSVTCMWKIFPFWRKGICMEGISSAESCLLLLRVSGLEHITFGEFNIANFGWQ